MTTTLAHKPITTVIARALTIVARATAPPPRPDPRHRAQHRDGCTHELSGLP